MIQRHDSHGHFFYSFALIAASSALTFACTVESSSKNGSDASTSNGGTTNSSGGTSGTGGTIGTSTGGSAGANGGGGTKTDASVTKDAATDSNTHDAALEAGPSPTSNLCADGGAPTGVLLVAGTKYCDTCSSSEVAAVDVAHSCVISRTTLTDSDVVPVASGGRGFVIERTNGALDILSPTGAVAYRTDLRHGDAGGAGSDPQNVVLVPGTTSASKAYVSLYDANAIVIVNADTGAVTGSVDLSSLQDPSDHDGSVDAASGFYDAVKNRVYFALQRTDVTSATAATGYAILCPSAPSLIVAIDPASDTLVDLNGGAPGKALSLELVAPATVSVDAANRRVLFADNGCVRPADGGFERALHGVESMNLDTLATSVLYAPTSQNFVSDLVLLGSNSALLETFDANFTSLWNAWTSSSPSLGASLAGVPDQVTAEGADSVLGVTFDTHGRASVVRYTISTQSLTVITAPPWAGTYDSVAGVALVK